MSRLIRTTVARWTPLALLTTASAIVSLSLAVADARAEISAEQVELVDRVMQKLLAVVDRPEGYDAWPPTWRVIDEDEVNAFAWTDHSALPKQVPFLRVYRGLIEDIAEMNEDRLAFVLGHELAHLTCGHVLSSDGDTDVLAAAFDREEELEADREGMKIALGAGYSYREAMGAPQQFHESGLDYTSFEGIGTDHPSWVERLALLESDEQQVEYWRAMSAFQTGVFLLRAQNYLEAEACFRRVTTEFPKCYEAYVNSGFAQLMQYCDALEPEDLRDFGVGQLIVGGFYERADSMGTRGTGIDEELWWDAVASLQKALVLKEDLLLAKANLAVAYLVHPSGRPDLGQAARLYADVAKLLEDEEATKNVDPLTLASLLANSWIGLYHSDESQNAAVMAQIDTYLTRAEQSGRTRDAASRVRAALSYTQASSLAAVSDESKQREALTLFENYLQSTPRESAWWPLAYEQYAAIANKLATTPKAEDELTKPRTDDWRIVSGVSGPNGVTISVSDNARDAAAALDENVEGERLVKGFGLKRYDFPELGVSLLGGRNVIAITLNGPNAPPVELRRAALGAKPQLLTIGMPRSEVEALLGDAWTSTNTSIIDPNQRHEFYEQVGVAVQYDDDNCVAEIIVTVAPQESGKG